jgi:hypothetical protein
MMDGEHGDFPREHGAFGAPLGRASRAPESRDAPGSQYYPDDIDETNLPG